METQILFYFLLANKNGASRPKPAASQWERNSLRNIKVVLIYVYLCLFIYLFYACVYICISTYACNQEENCSSSDKSHVPRGTHIFKLYSSKLRGELGDFCWDGYVDFLKVHRDICRLPKDRQIYRSPVFDSTDVVTADCGNHDSES